jgi:hypothetical protein
MHDGRKQLQNIQELRRYVADTLGDLEMLQADLCQLSEQVLYRGDAPCGVYFRLHGPRAVCLSAIWDLQRNSVLFYGSNGRRVHRTEIAIATPVSAA